MIGGLSLNLLLIYQPIVGPRRLQFFPAATAGIGFQRNRRGRAAMRRDRFRLLNCLVRLQFQQLF